MSALYQWHPYELQACVLGILTGLILGVRLGFLLARRQQHKP